MLQQIVLFCPATVESSFQNYKVILVMVDQTMGLKSQKTKISTITWYQCGEKKSW